MDFNKMKRELFKEITELLTDSPDNWKTKRQIMEMFEVSDTTIDEWVKICPAIIKYRKSDKATDTLGRTIRRGNLYNVRLIHDKIYYRPVKRA